MSLKQKKIKFRTRIKLSKNKYIFHTLYLPSNLPFSILSKTLNLIIIYAQKRFPLCIFFDLVYLFACLWPYPFFWFYPLIRPARDQEFLTGPQNVAYAEMPLWSERLIWLVWSILWFFFKEVTKTLRWHTAGEIKNSYTGTMVENSNDLRAFKATRRSR